MKKPKILFYVDSFGLGHITRQIALARALAQSAEVIFVSSGHLKFISASLPFATVQGTSFSLRFVPKDLGLDLDGTCEANKNLREEFEAVVKEEKTRLKKEEPDVVVADIPPEPFVAAQELGIPAIAVSNFGWTVQLEHLFGRASPEYELFASAYSKSDRTFVLPFNEPMAPFPRKQDVGLLRRRLTRKLPKRKGILSTFGKSASRRAPDNGIFYNYPPDDLESQNHVAAAEAVFSKPGYGIVSEAVSAGVPLFLRKRKHFQESEHILRSLESAKLVPDGVQPDEWISQEIGNIDIEGINRMRERYASNSDVTIAERLLSLCSG